MVAEVPGDGGEQPLRRRRTRLSHVEQDEAARPVGHFGHAGLGAGLPEERRLLVAGDAAHGHARQQRHLLGQGAAHGPDTPARRADLGQGRAGHAEELAELVGPRERADVEEQGPRRVGDVGCEHTAPGPAGEVPHHPGVDGGEHQVRAPFDAAGVEEPCHLGGREVRIEHEPRLFTHEGEMSGLAQRVAPLGGATVLPHDGAVQGAAARAVPGHDGLALVGDADGRHGGAGRLEVRRHLGEGDDHGIPDLAGVVLDPSGLGEVLGDLAVGDVGDGPGLVDDEGPDAGRPRVDGDHAGHGGRPYRWARCRGRGAPEGRGGPSLRAVSGARCKPSRAPSYQGRWGSGAVDTL